MKVDHVVVCSVCRESITENSIALDNNQLMVNVSPSCRCFRDFNRMKEILTSVLTVNTEGGVVLNPAVASLVNQS